MGSGCISVFGGEGGGGQGGGAVRGHWHIPSQGGGQARHVVAHAAPHKVLLPIAPTHATSPNLPAASLPPPLQWCSLRDMSENKVEEVAGEVGDLPSLTRLDLHTNELERVRGGWRQGGGRGWGGVGVGE